MRRFAGIIFSLALLFAALIGSAELLLYGTGSWWYEREYTKYNVQEHMIKEISLESLLDVSDKMMDYLRGDRDDLVVYARRDGVNQEFFTQREKDHMADVRGLFIGAIRIANAACIVCAVVIIYILISYRKALKRYNSGVTKVLRTAAPDKLPGPPVPPHVTLSRCYIGTSLAVLAIAGGISALCASDFNKYFIIFHHIFFDNDLWLLYPDRDDMINMLPEGFFSDTALAVVIIYAVLVVVLFAIAVKLSRRYRKAAR